MQTTPLPKAPFCSQFVNRHFKTRATPAKTPYLVVEEVHCVVVKFQRQSLQKWNIVRHDFLIREVEFMHNDGIDVIIGEQVI